MRKTTVPELVREPSLEPVMSTSSVPEPIIIRSNSNSSIGSLSSAASSAKVQIAHIKASKALPIPIREGVAALLPICLGQEYHAGEKLQALIDLLHEAQKLYILISGPLYRWTMQITENLSPEAACEKAIKDGEEWLEQHKEILNSSLTPVTVYKWEHWLLHARYPSIRKAVEEYYATEADFRQAFVEEVDKFINRLKKNKPTFPVENEKVARVICLEYLKEECAVLVVMNKTVPYTHFVYPGSLSKAIEKTFKKFEPPVLIVQPEFSSRTNTSSVQYVPLESSLSTRMRNIMKLDIASMDLTERGEVLVNCRVYHLKGAPSYVREKAVDLINKHVRIDLPLNFWELHEYKDLKTTTLIFAPKGTYPANKFDGESSKKYIPMQTADFKSVAELPTNSSTITLKSLHEEESRQWESIAKDIANSELLYICEAIKFYYSCLVAKGFLVQEASIIILDGVNGNKLYFSNANGTDHKDNELQSIKDGLFKIDPDINITIENIKTPNSIGLLEAIHIVNPGNLLKLIFESYNSLLQRKDSVETISSVEFNSADSTPERKNRPLGALVTAEPLGRKDRRGSVSSPLAFASAASLQLYPSPISSASSSPSPSPYGSPQPYRSPQPSPTNKQKTSASRNSVGGTMMFRSPEGSPNFVERNTEETPRQSPPPLQLPKLYNSTNEDGPQKFSRSLNMSPNISSKMSPANKPNQ